MSEKSPYLWNDKVFDEDLLELKNKLLPMIPDEFCRLYVNEWSFPDSEHKTRDDDLQQRRPKVRVEDIKIESYSDDEKITVRCRADYRVLW